jgi:hypothetical protein
VFNAFKFTKALEEAGFSRVQAEIQVQVITEIIEDDLATKQDLKILEGSIKHEMTLLRGEIQALEGRMHGQMQSLEGRMQGDMQSLEGRMQNSMQTLEYRLTIKLGTLTILGFTTMATLMKFWILH